VKLALQIFLGMAGAAVVSFLLWIAYFEYTAYRVGQSAREATADLDRRLAEDARKAKIEANRLADQVAQRRTEDVRAIAARLEQALRLKPGEECLGGFQGRPGTIIVRSVANGVPQSVQLLEYGRPVECVGSHRLDKTASQFPKR